MLKPIKNLTRNCNIAHNQAISRIEAKTAVWVEIGRSIRELTLAEILEIRRADQSRRDNAAPILNTSNELPGLKWEPPAKDKYKEYTRRPLLREASELLRPKREAQRI